MFVYSNKIIRFVEEIKKEVRLILSKEALLKVRGERFYDKTGRFSYPIKVVVYNQKSMLGYFDPEFYEMGFHEKLIYVSSFQRQNIIRHEVAHYLTFISHGADTTPHGEAFKRTCQELGFGEEVSSASICLDEGIEMKTDSDLFRKVEKLFALSKSSNPHEAEAAILKSRELLLKHNIEESVFHEEGERIVLKRILKQKKEDAKMRAIAHILETFFVSVVYNRSSSFTYLEILGKEHHVAVGEYVAAILEKELERLWQEAKKTARLQGLREKNSFLLGIAMGYAKKVHALKKEHTSSESKALLLIQEELIRAKEMVYQRLSSSKSGGKYSKNASSVGEKMGQNMTIQQGLSSQSSQTLFLIR